MHVSRLPVSRNVTWRRGRGLCNGAYTGLMNTTAPRLFRPGAGAMPPALTGRDGQQAVLSRCLADLVGGSAPPHDVVLLGPRGNGKTALLHWFRALCGTASVDVVALTPQRIPNHEALVDALAPRRGIAKWLPRKVGVGSLGSAEWQLEGAAHKDLTRALMARCQRKPVVVLLDEAHTLPLDIGSTLLNASQQVRPGAPFLLVLAGTPGLPDHLSAMNASFWSRLGEGLLGVGRLEEAAAREALVRPLAAHGVSIDDDALDAVVEYSQRYPYFIQLWGDALWKQHAATGTTPITTAAVVAAQPAVAANVTDYYQSRYRELRADGLLTAALAVARLFQAHMDATATEQELDTALAHAGIDDVAGRLATLDSLNRLGYVWSRPGQVPPIVWSAGIPSLMTFMLENVPASR